MQIINILKLYFDSGSFGICSSKTSCNTLRFLGVVTVTMFLWHTSDRTVWHFNNTVVGLSRNCSYVDQPVSVPSKENCIVHLVLLSAIDHKHDFMAFLGREHYEDTWASLSTHKVAYCSYVFMLRVTEPL